MKELKELMKRIKGYRFKYVTALLAIAVSSLLTFVSPMVIRMTIDSIIGDTALSLPEALTSLFNAENIVGFLKNNIWVCSLFLFVVAAGRGLFQFAKGKWAAEASESIIRKIREDLFDHIQKLPFSYHSKSETGDLIQRATSDIDTIKNFLSMQLLEIGRIVFMIVLVLPFMLKLNWKMTILSLGFMPLIFAFSVYFFYKIQHAFQLTDEAEASMSNILQENITGIRVVRAFAKQHDEIVKFDHENRHYSDCNFNHIRLLALFWGSSDLMCFGQLTLVLVTSVYLTAKGAMSIGTMTAFLSYTSMLVWPIRHLGTNLSNMGKTIVSVRRIQAIFDEETEDLESGMKPALSGKIELKNVSFGYEEETVLDDISFTINPGETVAILGKTGAGKSTLMHLLPRYYDYKSGSIKFDNVELKDISKAWIRKNIAYVLQEPFLFSRTVFENIKIGASKAVEKEVENAAKIASVHQVILDFEKGYETEVGERGVTLSGGQKQRVAIARSILMETPILIFDDSLSAVDTETDAMIRKALAKRKHKATTFIIAHRITTLAEADKIIVMDQGRIVQAGTHDTLINQSGLYQRIWAIQNNLEEELEHEMDEKDSHSMESMAIQEEEKRRNSA